MRNMFGLVALIFFLLSALALQGGSAATLWSWHAFVIVLGGSATAAFMSFPADRVLAVPRLTWEALKPASIEMVEVVAKLMKLSTRLRTAGIQGTMKDIANIEDPFLKRGMQYITEGFDSQEIQDLLEAEMLAIRGRHRTNIAVFESLGGFCPTLGILGTVLSMVSVLGNLDKPEQLGPEIATAMVATLYGVGAANLLFLPLSNKLRKNSEEELRIRWVMVEIILAMQAGANPRLINERLQVSLPPSTRKTIRASAKTRRSSGSTAGLGGAEPEMAVPQYDEG
ncbi:MAG: MotA/TolQ/ExbB proton channel family protein [Candidatus Sericytochromatia bacterium]|nr:MotA/TolQ/ExbB proton channel family protein [Candidatus Tanganyikabacteria bacterium]